VTGERQNILFPMLHAIMAACLMLMALGVTAVAGPLEDAKAAHDRGDYATELRLLRPLADEGDALAEFKLGEIYDNGQGVTRSYTEAAKWYGLAAAQGNASAQFYLGAMYNLGQGIPQDYAKAIKWWRLAAAQGDDNAQFNLGQMYNLGQGVPQDYAEALKWYRLAAAQGSATAQTILGEMYAEGHGVPQDYVQSHMWFNLSAANAMNPFKNDAIRWRDGLASQMTSAQIAEAQRLAREWKPTSSAQ
jgi:TPR repeat protein